jgi:hypothetical protein
MVVQAAAEAKHAKDEAGKDFPLIHAHALLGLWSALESLIEDAAIAWLIYRPQALQLPDFAKIRVPIVEFQLLTTEEQMAYLIAEVQRDQRTDQRQGVRSIRAST